MRNKCAVTFLTAVMALSISASSGFISPVSAQVVPRIDGPGKSAQRFEQVGTASWYGPAHHGRKTASGAVYDMNRLTAAHPTLPLGSTAVVTNTGNGRSVKVTVNDRGPYFDDRIIDLSAKAAEVLGMKEQGTAKVSVRLVPENEAEGAAKSRKMHGRPYLGR